MRASGIASDQTTVAVARLLSSVSFGLLWFALGPTAALQLVALVLLLALPVALLALRGLDARETSAA